MNNFNKLISTIEQVHGQMQTSAANAVNQSLTIRNWLVGYYIVEFEQSGEDRAVYGTNLLGRISKKIKGLSAPELSRCRQFYMVYPQILGTLSQIFKNQINDEILGTLSQESILINPQFLPKVNDILDNSLSEKHIQVPPKRILNKLSFSHLVELIKIDSSLKRTFYELECIKGTWSVRELKRQINSLYFERSGLSANPEKLSALVNQNLVPQAPTDIIKNIYSFEFLDISIKPIVIGKICNGGNGQKSFCSTISHSTSKYRPT